MEKQTIHKKLTIKQIIDENYKTKTFLFNENIDINPGQFIMLWLPSVDEKPFTLSYKNPAAVTVELKGNFTKELFNLKQGDNLFYRGPFGNGFATYSKKAVVVVGGMGLAGVSLLVESLKNPMMIFGAKQKKDLFFTERFKMDICTDDGSIGYKGFATDKLNELLKHEKYDIIYTCGPEIMMKTVFDIAEKYNIPCEASLERFMRCGIGICGSCACGSKLVCKDGPVFSSDDLREMKDFGRYTMLKNGKKASLQEYYAQKCLRKPLTLI